MEGTFEYFPKEFDSLDPSLREEAFIMARKLLLEGATEKEAIAKAMSLVQEWYYGLEDDS